jgi:hypothetical protein
MAPDRYTVRIAGSTALIVDASYETLITSIIKATLEAAVARVSDTSTWEQEELRRHGLSVLEIARNGRAVWISPADFQAEAAEARRNGSAQEFDAGNELDPAFVGQVDADVRTRWKRAGYDTPSLRSDMRILFSEIEADARTRESKAITELVVEIVAASGG